MTPEEEEYMELKLNLYDAYHYGDEQRAEEGNFNVVTRVAIEAIIQELESMKIILYGSESLMAWQLDYINDRITHYQNMLK